MPVYKVYRDGWGAMSADRQADRARRDEMLQAHVETVVEDVQQWGSSSRLIVNPTMVETVRMMTAVPVEACGGCLLGELWAMIEGE